MHNSDCGICRLHGEMYNFSDQLAQHRQLLVTLAAVENALHSCTTLLDLTLSAESSRRVFDIVDQRVKFHKNQVHGTVLVMLLNIGEWRLHAVPSEHGGFVMIPEKKAVNGVDITGQEAMEKFWAPHRFWGKNLSRFAYTLIKFKASCRLVVMI